MRIRQHVNPLKAALLVSRAGGIELGGRETEVEIGCADAQFLFERARQDPSRLELGLEIRRELIPLVNRRATAEGVAVRAILANANVDFRFMFAEGSLARVFVNFPDPWFKRRHWKRRMLDEVLARCIVCALRPDGELFFQSDVWDVSLDALAVLEARFELENLAGSWSFWKQDNPYGARTKREASCQGRIWRLWFRRCPVKGPSRPQW